MLRNRDWLCMECGKNTNNSIDYYMLKHAVWSGIVKNLRGMLCFSCAENKIGHKIERSDIIDCSLNRSHPILKEILNESNH